MNEYNKEYQQKNRVKLSEQQQKRRMQKKQEAQEAQ